MKCLFIVVLSLFAASLPAQEKVQLANEQLQIEWTASPGGWKISRMAFKKADQWVPLLQPEGNYTLLYAAEKPGRTTPTSFTTVAGTPWPDTLFRYLKNRWADAATPVALNTAGTAFSFYPQKARQVNNHTVQFVYDAPMATVTTLVSLDNSYKGDLIIQQQLQTKKAGYFSLASPTLFSIPEKDMQWATVPGYFQGRSFEKNIAQGYAYGQGVPEVPALYRERGAGTLTAIITINNNISVAATPDPQLGRDPWRYDHKTNNDWDVAVSHKNRNSALFPTVYYPVLGEPLSLLKSDTLIQYGLRISFINGPWDKMLAHVVNDINHFKEQLALRTNTQSLSKRVERMYRYLTNPKTSLVNFTNYKGLEIAGQSYKGGVIGSQGDAIKNSDYGAMWMLANATNDPLLKDSLLPYALNFKLAQQQTDTGFFKGAAIGQYYLTKRKKFVEEWGDFVEPISLTYYVMLDIGNILLFEPANKELQRRLRLGADLLVQWQKPDGSWDVAYDRVTKKPLFTDLKDLRPTFYGLLVAARILKDEKYLAAAKKGANWFIKNAVDKGAFIGVCGDTRYAPDFATGQSAQALLDLFELTHDQKYRDAAITTAKIYCSSIMTHPQASEKTKLVKGIAIKDWQIEQSGLSFEHGGILGSSNDHGPILLCSHAGLFVRMFQLTGDSLFIEMARAAAIGRDAFLDEPTSVASYYWDVMSQGAGPYPHHAWWQIGWITDYLLAETQFRTKDAVWFPRGFVTPKVGPHQSVGFQPGSIYGTNADLILRNGLVECDNPDIEYITAQSKDKKKVFLILLNDINKPVTGNIRIQWNKLDGRRRSSVTMLPGTATTQAGETQSQQLEPYGVKVLAFQ
ncbi:glycoside hydrolase family protein [Niabella soli]|uniref:Glycerophosphoryl diester phosphodiesterase n=1 Tax=Niabella soli DSM 19437 TaxID=929713 RepID=W0F3G4_9BACT|nr:hypothetical protein [Niabella soli]AHF16039.1 hypothetical protein NIASO_14510 [Niabella soli DSM 19437]